MEINGDQPPLIWPQFESAVYTRRRSSSIPTILVPAMIGVISAAIFLVFVTFFVPPILSVTSQILQPSSVKRGWDSINVVLVVFAILCGVLARRNDDELSSSPLPLPSSHGVVEEEEVMTVGEESKISSSSEQWFDDVYDADRLKIYESLSNRSFSPVTGSLPLRRSSTSYPDLRNGVLKETGDRRFRFHDDFGIDQYRSIPNRSNVEIEESEPKEIIVDKFVVKPSSPPPPPPQQPPEQPPPPAVEVSQKPKRTRRKQETAKRTHSDPTKFKRAFQPPPSPPPPPPPPPPPLITATPPRKQGSLQRRKSNAAKEIKMVLASIYNQGKRKKKVQISKRKERHESPAVMVTEPQPPAYYSSFPPPSPPPPPPPPPPPLRSSQSVFYGLFKKGTKSKKIHSVPAPPPPPPPRKIQYDPQTPPRRVKSGRPPRPTKPINFNEENGQASPLNQITPPPPPPPPFRVPPLKFVVSGDFAKIRSNQSSRCSSPEREVIDLGWGLELTHSDNGGDETNISAASRSGFCASPDVNTKADNFIARLRDEWRLDKMNSLKGKSKFS